MVSLRLLSLVKEECLLFNPNLHSNGLKCAMSPHGLVLVAVAGTVHRDNACLGVFEQIFGLISCPVRNYTWKIKLVNLKIVGENAMEPGMRMEEPCIKYEPNQLREFYDGNELTVWTSEILSILSQLGEGLGCCCHAVSLLWVRFAELQGIINTGDACGHFPRADKCFMGIPSGFALSLERSWVIHGYI